MRGLNDISTVIPVLNPVAERFAACLASIADVAQATGGRPELIIVDDGSDPPIAQKDLPDDTILIRHDTPQGPLAARLTGAQRASRPFLHFVDADDALVSDIFADLVQHPADADIVTFAAAVIAGDGRSPHAGKPDQDHAHKTRLDRASAYFAFRYRFAMWNKIYRRDLALAVFAQLTGLLGTRYGEDFLFNAFAFWMADSHVHRQQLGYHYIQHPGQVTALTQTDVTARSRLISDHVAVMQAIEALLQDAHGDADQPAALLAFHARRQHARMRIFDTVLGLKRPRELDAILPDLPEELSRDAPWMRQILMLRTAHKQAERRAQRHLREVAPDVDNASE